MSDPEVQQAYAETVLSAGWIGWLEQSVKPVLKIVLGELLHKEDLTEAQRIANVRVLKHFRTALLKAYENAEMDPPRWLSSLVSVDRIP